MAKQLGEFALKATSVSYAADGATLSVDFDGTGTGFGTILGSLIFHVEPGSKKGPCSWRSQAFLDNGDQLAGTGEGVWEESAKHTWRIRSIVTISDGQVLSTDGQFDLATRSYNGKISD